MFTIDQIKAAHATVKSGADFPAYVQMLKKIGLTHYDMLVKNGQGIYFGANSFKVEGTAVYPEKIIADTASGAALKHIISIHQQGHTDYLTFCQQAADAGVEKWTTYVTGAKVVYYDKRGNELLTEPIPDTY
jgi:uncharacterized protein YbcV (DUF1398 family)